MCNNVENSNIYHFKLNPLKNTQYVGLGGHFSDLGKTGFKTQKLSFCQFNSGQMKHNFKKMKEVFVKNISIFNPWCQFQLMTLVRTVACIFFEYLHTFLHNLEFQSLILNLSKILAILVIHVQFNCYAVLACIFMLMACILHHVSITVKKC